MLALARWSDIGRQSANTRRLTRVLWRPTIQGMAHENLMHDADARLRQLEARIDELILACERLKQENWALRSHQQALAAQRASLIDKHETARSRVEAIIHRLKSMERGT